MAVIEGVKLIRHNMGGINNPDDPTYPFRIEILCRVPSFMEVAAAMIFGREEVVLRAKTMADAEAIIEANKFRSHPRLISLTITQPEKDQPPDPAEKKPDLIDKKKKHREHINCNE